VSAIAHWIEQYGITTIVVGLIRLHLEKMLPPRSLWVPFELGRPLGAPNDSVQQRQVLLKALQLVETATPGQIIDFDEDDSRSHSDDNWRAPQIGQHDCVVAECGQLKALHEKFVINNGRTSVGVSGISIGQCAELIDHVIEQAIPASSPRDEISDVLMLRLAIDDIKSYFIEAALWQSTSANRGQNRQTDIGYPSSEQLNAWFWIDTYTGAQLRQLREDLIQSENSKLEQLARRFIIPHRWRISP